MKKPLSSAKVLVVGLARNCEDEIGREIQKISSAFSEAKTVNFLIIESDSDDKTLIILENLSKNDNFEFISLGNIRNQYPKRTERIAICRNRYLEELRTSKKYNDTDYVVVADLDGVNSEITATAVESCWKLDEDWDACFANQCAPYYDIWALRHDIWNPLDCFEQEAFFKTYKADDFFNRYTSILSKMICIPKDAAPIRVKSAFGGLAIYKKNWLFKGEYLGVNNIGDEVCEHVHFHLSHMKDARLYIVPSLINCGWNEHSKHCNKIYMLILFCVTRLFSIDTIKKFKRYISKK